MEEFHSPSTTAARASEREATAPDNLETALPAALLHRYIHRRRDFPYRRNEAQARASGIRSSFASYPSSSSGDSFPIEMPSVGGVSQPDFDRLLLFFPFFVGREVRIDARDGVWY